MTLRKLRDFCVMTVLFGLILGCSKSKEPTIEELIKENLVGAWEAAGDGTLQKGTEVEFLPDGVFYITYRLEGEEPIKAPGLYTLSGKRLKLDHNADDDDPKHERLVTIKRITATELVVVYEDGKVETLLKK